ncbi:MAG TPA: hypothetical protein VFS40_12555 [Gemmatimonadales bacterium]|nr:hypothetical protein [Gemmatimonadales bacterium]
MSRLQVSFPAMWERAIGAILALGLAACGADHTGPSSQATPRLSVESPARNERPPEFADVPRFALELAATGPFAPGRTIVLQPRVQGLHSTDNAEVIVTLPELEGRQLERELGVPGLGREPLKGLLRARDHIGRGQVWQRSLPIRIDEPGYYRVTLLARDLNAPRHPSDGAPREADYVEAWLLVTPEGGRLTPAFDPALVPPAFVAEPGPFRAATTMPSPMMQCNPDIEDCSPENTRVCDDFLFYYVNPVTLVQEPILHASVTGKVVSSTGTLLKSISTTTDENGFLKLCSGKLTDQFEFVVQPINSGHRMRRADGFTFGDYTLYTAPRQRFTGNAAPRVLYPTADSRLSAMHASFTHTVNRTTQVFGYTRSRIDVNVHEDPSYGTASYGGLGDVINIGLNRMTSSELQAWTPAHEYGHAFHEKALGGINGGGCPSPHFLQGAHNLGCAISEGYADFHAAITRGPGLNYIDVAIEINTYLQQATEYQDTVAVAHGSADDGSIVEGAVAAFLYDLVDGPGSTTDGGYTISTDDDTVSWPGRWVADVFRTCEYQDLWGWHRPNGIDQIIYCMEQRLDPAITGSSTYFPTRSAPPLAIRHGQTNPTGFNPESVRALWVKNLYTDALTP